MTYRLYCFSLKNFGDALTPYVFDRYGIGYELVEDHAEADLFGIGSILRRVGARQTATVWSSGMISPRAGGDLRFGPGVRILSLRGPLTRDKVKSPDVSDIPLGDGGMILRRFADSYGGPKRARIGLLPHIQDRHTPFVREAAEQEGVQIINVLGEIDTVLTDIAACDCLLSSSLHGVISADALGVPNAFVTFPGSGKTVDDRGKFEDYGLSISRDIRPLALRDLEDLETFATMCLSGRDQADPARLDAVTGSVERCLLQLK